MYTRDIHPAPEKPVVSGSPAFGSFSGRFGRFDIRGMTRPFGDLPLPNVISNSRIKEVCRFLFCDSNTVGEIELFDAGYFSFMETTLWNRKTGRKIAYRQLQPPGFMRLPGNLENSTMSCRTRSRYVRILTRFSKHILHADFDFLGSDLRPPCEGRLDMDLALPGVAELSSLIPYGVKRRCLISYQLTGPVSGWIHTGYDDHPLENAVGFFDIRKAYFALRTKYSKLVGLGEHSGRVCSFQLGNSVYHDDYTYNDNVLFLDGRVVPLPPVRITRPEGVTGPWIIQDTESMVDLIFTPVSDSSRKLSAFVVRTDYHTVYGFFDGVLLTPSGERVVLKAYPGIGKKILLRV